MILLTIAKLAGSVTLHVANRSYMKYALECLEPTVFKWAEAVLFQMKEYLTKEKGGRKNNFNYGSILISFILERVPLMYLQHVTLSMCGPRDPQMQRWVELMSIHAGQSTIIFSISFFTWFK